MGRPPPTLVSRQAPVRIDLALERGQKRRTRPRRQAPGIMRRVEKMCTDAATQSQLGWGAPGGLPSRHQLSTIRWARSRQSSADSVR